MAIKSQVLLALSCLRVVFTLSLTLDDSLYNIETIWGQWGAEDTRGFVVIDSTEEFTYYSVIKKDRIIKWKK